MQGTAESLERRALWVTFALLAVIVVDVVALWADALEIRLIDRVLDGEHVAISTLDSDDVRQGVVGMVELAVFLVAVVLFLRWFHRAYANLPSLRSERRFKGGWAIGAWFVPILNLWRPKQIANDIWRGSDPSPRSVEKGIISESVPSLLGFWWAAWIAASLLATRAGLAWAAAPSAADAGAVAAIGITTDAEDVRRAAWVDLVSCVVDIPAALLAIGVVRASTLRQRERADALASSRRMAGDIVEKPISEG